MPIDRSLLARGLTALDLPPDGPLFDDLCRFLDEIERQNPALGLVKATDDELVIKHALDSLAALPVIRHALEGAAAARAASGERPLAPSIADLGTGAGLPGVPLALALPEASVDLIDRMTRRTRFLEETLRVIDVQNARVIEEQVERSRGRYDAVVFRAFRPFERKLYKRVFALCDAYGSVIAYKGKLDKARAEVGELEGLYASVEIVPLRVPFLDEERCAVVLRPL